MASRIHVSPTACGRVVPACALALVLVLSGCTTVRTTGIIPLSGAPITYTLQGSGGPTVVFEAGMGDGKEVWARVMPTIESTHQVFAYDRPGYGGSRSVPGARDPCTIAAEERNLLRAVGVKPPYLLVGHSIGGLYQYVYAKLYPEDVAGVVLVDPTHPGWKQSLRKEEPHIAAIGHALSRIDVAVRREFDDMDDCLSRIDTNTPLQIPARVLVQDKLHGPLIILGGNDLYERESTDWSRLAGSQVEIVRGSAHYIQRDRPQAVIDAIGAVSSSIRAPVASSRDEPATLARDANAVDNRALPMEEVVVESLRHPEARSYARLVQGARIFDQYRQLAPRASLRFRVFPRKAGVDMHNLKVRIVSNSVSIPLELDDELRFELPIDQTAVKENADLIYNRRDGSLGWRTDVRTPGLPENARRLGDLRLECRVELMGAHVARGFDPLGLAGHLRDPCVSSQVTYHFIADKPIFNVTLISGTRSASLSTQKLYGNDWDPLLMRFMDWPLLRDRVFVAPLRDETWPDETLLEFESMATE
jgi:pimeloyl-ACP methyl ester carboxylesterase